MLGSGLVFQVLYLLYCTCTVLYCTVMCCTVSRCCTRSAASWTSQGRGSSPPRRAHLVLCPLAPPPRLPLRLPPPPPGVPRRPSDRGRSSVSRWSLRALQPGRDSACVESQLVYKAMAQLGALGHCHLGHSMEDTVVRDKYLNLHRFCQSILFRCRCQQHIQIQTGFPPRLPSTTVARGCMSVLHRQFLHQHKNDLMIM